ncbi:DoxX family protein [Zobellia nedashkovskayae]|uniref:DoxX family protein n=1 Tax=Zobellia nedashkovskayae TaxID=2779510 RepID=UPI00188DBC83|nr:DoxX family protein [Zobellia nedashkovskayae]
MLTIFTFFSALSFLFFGFGCFFLPQMKKEFVRYGLDKFRTVVGALQLVGGLGLLLGYFYSPTVQTAAALSLSILMILGFAVRLKIKDGFFQSAPSLLYALLNAYLFYKLITII